MLSERYAQLDVALAGIEAAWAQARVLLWSVEAGELRMLATRRCYDSDIEAALAVWRTKWRRLLAGEMLRLIGEIYWPVRAAGQERVVAVLQGVGGTCSLAHGPQVMDYVAWELHIVASALAHPGVESGADALDRAVAPAPAVTVLASADRDETERAKTLATLKRMNWNMSAAARVLGLTRQAVWKRLRRWGVKRPEPSPFAPRRE